MIVFKTISLSSSTNGTRSGSRDAGRRGFADRHILWVRVFKDIQHVPLSDEEHDLFESDAAVDFQRVAFRVLPGENISPISV